MPPFQPMRLIRAASAFDHPDFIYELKIDGFRGLAFIDEGRCRLVSRNAHTFGRWESLKREIATSLRCQSAVVDGEIACLDPDGRSNFYALMFRGRAPFYCAFDLLMLDGEDMRPLPLLERKRRLFEVMPGIESRVRYVDHIHETGVRFYELACKRELEGIVAKYAEGNDAAIRELRDAIILRRDSSAFLKLQARKERTRRAIWLVAGTLLSAGSIWALL